MMQHHDVYSTRVKPGIERLDQVGAMHLRDWINDAGLRAAAAIADGVFTLRGGAATVLNLETNPEKALQSLTVRSIANEVLIGIMGITLIKSQ